MQGESPEGIGRNKVEGKLQKQVRGGEPGRKSATAERNRADAGKRKEMKKLDRKTQMMDAGTALFETKGGYGTVLGQLRAELAAYGRVFAPGDVPEEALPHSAGAFDLFLDYSTVWRTRYISCRIEDAGDSGGRTGDGETIRRYAAEFKEGNRSTVLRAAVHLAVAAGLLAVSILPGPCLVSVLAAVLILPVLYLWIVPSRAARKTVGKLLEKTRGGRVFACASS